jgi:hypothetical protein
LEEKAGYLEQEVGDLFQFFNAPGNDAQSTKTAYFTLPCPLILTGSFIPFLRDKVSYAATLSNPQPDALSI